MILPDDRKVDFAVTWDEAEPTIGSVAHFSAILTGYDQLVYTLQWQCSQDGENWMDLENAADETMDMEITLDNYDYYWRVVVKVMNIQES